jgi:formate hydrogenlyase subunit 4
MPLDVMYLMMHVLIGLFIVVTSLVVGLFFLGIDRKIAARFQSRIGPPIVQPFRDLVKLMSKQTVVPEKAVRWLYNLAPILALASALLLVLYLPFFGVKPILSGYGDLIVVAYLLIMPALAMVLAGYASGNTYATVGAQRKMIMMLSYEFPFAVVIFAMVWNLMQRVPGADGFSFAAFSQYPVFSVVGVVGFVGVILLFLMLLVSLCAELVKVPFDAPEADTELAEGLLVDYSGRNYALFMLADAVKLTAFITLVIGLFFPCKLARFVDLGGIAMLGEVLFFLLKFFVIALVGLTFQRVAFARLKITQATKFFWIISAGVSLVAFVMIYVDVLIA